MLVDTSTRDMTGQSSPCCEYRLLIFYLVEIFGHRIPAPILFAPVGINKLYTPNGELVPAKIAGELGLPVSICRLTRY